MEKEDLKIGKTYMSKDEKFKVELIGFDSENDPVLKPLTNKQFFLLYDKNDELTDPACKAGCFGLLIEIFLENFICNS